LALNVVDSQLSGEELRRRKKRAMKSFTAPGKIFKILLI
jgi:hypothetical protein